jgi:hypothetical protein
VLYDIYFLPPQFHFLSNLVPVVYEKTEMVPPSNFPSKTNVQSRHPTGVGVYARHLTTKKKGITDGFFIDGFKNRL